MRSVTSALLVVGSGVLADLRGELITYVGVMDLIAGYDPERVVDEERPADFVGTNTLYVGGLTIGVGVLERSASTADTERYRIVFAIAVFVAAGRTIRGVRRYESSSERTGTD